MRRGRISKLLCQAVLPCLAAFGSGCGLIDVDMTSTPDTVRWGEPVTFDIKLTNRSQCPVKTAAALLEAFIPIQEFNAEFSAELPPDAPPELLELIEEVRAFFDALCSGGEPMLPELPTARAACTRGPDELVCTATGPAPAQTEGGTNLTFATLGNRLRCETDSETMRCTFRLPLPGGAAAAGSAALATQTLSCLTAEDLGVLPTESEGEAICFVGTFPVFEGLAPGAMATGQVALPARGAGTVRNLIISISDEEEDLGVCKGGSNAGDACAQDDSTDCEDGGTCGEGICVDGPNQGKGCDQATVATDCGMGATCALCAEPTGGGTGFLPIDCTTTYIQPNPAPAASPWGLAALAAALCAGGTFWLRRRMG